jgi:hypothetical protein
MVLRLKTANEKPTARVEREYNTRRKGKDEGGRMKDEDKA